MPADSDVKIDSLDSGALEPACAGLDILPALHLLKVTFLPPPILSCL
jgi:hypothetical protein